jgi:hypothetical protein
MIKGNLARNKLRKEKELTLIEPYFLKQNLEVIWGLKGDED